MAGCFYLIFIPALSLFIMASLLKTLKLIEEQVRDFTIPSVTRVSRNNDPYRVLISCILSLRTKDKTTIEASNRLFNVADNPYSMVKLTTKRLERMIYPVGFYHNKARVILEISRKIIKDYKGRLLRSEESLLKFNCIGN